jgi:hypothetical protein
MSFRKNPFLYVDHNSPLGRAILKERESMATYDNTNSGILTKNDKGDNASRPDYRGSINVNGAEFWLSAWIKDGREGTKLEGQKYLSLSVKPKEESATAPAPAPKAAPVDDDIPF